MSDVISAFDAVNRTVEPDGKGDYWVVLSNSYATDIDDLWDACTSKERLPRWFAPVTGDFKVGGSYQVEGNAHGVFETCDPPHGFSATWDFGEGSSRIKVELAPEGTHTRLTLRHWCPDDDDWQKFGPSAAGIGWDLGLYGLGQYLAGEIDLTDGDDPMEWFASEEGQTSIQRSSELWRESHIESGADDDTATRMASNSLAFYRGEEPEG